MSFRNRHFRILIFAGVLCAEALTLTAKPKGKPTPAPAKPVVREIVTSTRCPACRVLEAHLKRIGAVTAVKRQVEQPDVTAYPTVFYKGGTADNGEKIYSGEASTERVIEVIEWQQVP